MEPVHWIDMNGTDRGALGPAFRPPSELAPVKGRMAVVNFNGMTLYYGEIVGIGRVNVRIRTAKGYVVSFKRDEILAVAENGSMG